VKAFVSALACAVCLACGSSNGTSPNNAMSGAPSCFDASGVPTTSCALTPSGNVCGLGDANACVPLTKVEVYAATGDKGACLHLVYTNQCADEIYADTCIEHDAAVDGGPPSWQCWTSSTLPSATIDVSQCGATGRYFFVSTTSSGKLTVYETNCPSPM
jgi:hypothetical protein